MPTDAEILDWLEAHAISVRIQQNERQSFVVPATRAAIRFEMTSGNVEDSPNHETERTRAKRRRKTMSAKQTWEPVEDPAGGAVVRVTQSPSGEAARNPQAPSARSAPVPGSAALAEIESYFSNGGLFNPEQMDHRKVSELVLLCRSEIERLRLYCRCLEDEVVGSIGLQKARHAAGLCPRNGSDELTAHPAHKQK